MYARCPSCQSVYQLVARQLAEAAGTVRCGNCGKTFNALATLFEEHPAVDEQPCTGSGVPPLLQQPSTVQPELPGVSLAPPNAFEGSVEAANEAPVLVFADSSAETSERNWPWVSAAAALALCLGVQVFLYRSDPDYLALWPGQTTPEPAAVGNTIQVLARDLHRHPSLDDAIIVSLTLGNTGERSQAWPVLEFRLFDPTQQVLGVRRLAPEDYLDRPRRIEDGMPPGLIVPVIAEFVVGTTQPSGFDFRLL